MQANGTKRRTQTHDSYRNSEWGQGTLDDRSGDEAETLRLLRDAQEQEEEAAHEGPFKWVEEVADEGLDDNP